MNKVYQIDAFTSKIFGGNPASVCPLESWLSDEQMQKIAAENNLPETVFFVKNETGFDIRWFTPTIEINLCGHATLATAYVLYQYLGYTKDSIAFDSKSGKLYVYRAENELLTLDFPTDSFAEIPLTEAHKSCFNFQPKQAFRGKTNILFTFENEFEIQNLVPNLKNISLLDCGGVIVTAKGNKVDFVSRFFGPQSGIDEDPVTGSAHTTLIPFWANILQKTIMHAKQLSKREGELFCELKDKRVLISGKYVTYMIGEYAF